MTGPSENRPLDVDRVMHDLRARVATADPAIPLFSTPDSGGDAAIVLRDTTFESPRPVVGKGITETKRTIVRAVWPVLHDLVEQINAALLEFRYVEDRIDGVEGAVGTNAAGEARLASISSEISELAARIRHLEDLAAGPRLAALEDAEPRTVLPHRPLSAQPISAEVAGLAAGRARVDDLGEDRLDAYRTVFDAHGPELELSWDPSRAGDPLKPLRDCAADSLGGVLAVGFGDHLTAAQWMAFSTAAHAAVCTGGGVAVEMINSTTPTGLALRSRDPSLAPPVHPETVDFLFRAAGFSDVEVRFLGSFPEDLKAPIADDPDWFDSRLNQMASVINRLVVGQPLVAVLACK